VFHCAGDHDRLEMREDTAVQEVGEYFHGVGAGYDDDALDAVVVDFALDEFGQGVH